MLILADSGILLRLFHPADPFHATVDAAVSLLRSRGEKLAYSLQNATEFWNVSTRPITARGGQGLDVTETEHRLGLIEATFALLTEPPAVYSIWRQLVVTHSVQGKQVHDARLVALMQAHGISHILTLNGGDFARYPGIVAIDPASVVPPPAPPNP
jgi:predicted nucleic acid-binding protein